MRRTRIAGAILAVRVLLAIALLPLLAYAADAGGGGFEGTYIGIGDGVGNDGGGGSASVTVWVEDLGDTARFTIEVLEYGIVVAAEGPISGEGDALSVPITVDSMGVSGSATIGLIREGGVWVLTAEGAGTALGYDGTGSLVADQVSTGFGLPNVGDQIGDMIGAIVGGPSKAKEAASKPRIVTYGAGTRSRGIKGGSAPAFTPPPKPAPGTTTEQPAPGTTAEQPGDGQAGASGDATATPTLIAEPLGEPTPLSPASPEPPFADFNRLGAAALAVVVLILQIILA